MVYHKMSLTYLVNHNLWKILYIFVGMLGRLDEWRQYLWCIVQAIANDLFTIFH